MAGQRPSANSAFQFAEAGLGLLRVRNWDSKHPATKKPSGKAPIDKHWAKSRSESPETIQRWVSEKGGNWGVRVESGWLVIDWDHGRDTGYKLQSAHGNELAPSGSSLSKLASDFGLELDSHLVVRTGSGGRHVWCKNPSGHLGRETNLEKYPGIELKGHTGGARRQVLGPGSRHPDGGFYRALTDVSPEDTADASKTMLQAFIINMPPKSKQGAGAQGWGNLEPESVGRALKQMDAANFRDHDRWLTLMMACHWVTAGAGVEEFIDWSTSDPQYADHGEQIRYRWDSLSSNVPGDGAVKAGFLFKSLKEEKVNPKFWPSETLAKLFEIDGDDTDYDFAIPDAAAPMPKQDRVIAEMNKNHAVVMLQGQTRIINNLDSCRDQGQFVEYARVHDMREKYRNRKVMVTEFRGDKSRKVEKNYFDFWLDHPARREFAAVEFAPGRPKEFDSRYGRIFNLWAGFAFDPRQRGGGEWSKYKAMLRECVCDGDSRLFDYLINWMAYSVQHPSGPQGVAVILKGPKGAGKTTAANYWGRMFGNSFYETDDSEDVFGRFNFNMEKTQALVLNEAYWAGDKKLEGKLKSRITERSIRVEQKFLPAKIVRNHLKIMMTTNENYVAPASKDERRFFVVNVSSNRTNDHAYWQSLHDQMEHGGVQAMLYDLMRLDIGAWTPHNGFFHTRELKEQISQHGGVLVEFWRDCLESGTLPFMRSIEGNAPNDFAWISGAIMAPAHELRELLQNFASERNATLPGEFSHRPDASFTGFLKQLLPNSQSLRTTQQRFPDTEEFFAMKRDKQGRARAYKIPSLIECREYYTEVFGYEFDDVEEEIDVSEWI